MGLAGLSGQCGIWLHSPGQYLNTSRMSTIALIQPRQIVFGDGCAGQLAEGLQQAGLKRPFIITSEPLVSLVEPIADQLRKAGLAPSVYQAAVSEPTIGMCRTAMEAARSAEPDAIVGIGGGSALDMSKVVAALLDGRQDMSEILGIDQLIGRKCFLACLPTTAGTGSEVSPIAIVLDESDQSKKGAVSRHLIPEAAYVDPLLTHTMPPGLTGSTGIDALTHCIEAYTNLFAHPAIDLYALEGIRLIAGNLARAVAEGDDRQARANMARASLYGGLCLGPVNTAAVHALAYPLGAEFHVAHGLSNAVLLAYVMEFNLSAAADRYAQVAVALGVDPGESVIETAKKGPAKVKQLAESCGVATHLSQLDIPVDAIGDMARSAMKVTRLLKNNPRPMTAEDAESIYRAAY